MSVNLWDTDDEQNVRYYTDLIAKYGVDVRALDWGSRESQELRFSVLTDVGQLHDATVLDVGCGLGDFFAWLTGTGRGVKYTGIDIAPKMIEVARQRFPETRFEVRNLLENDDCTGKCYDLVFASGIFTHRQIAPVSFLKAMINKMFSLSTRAVALNSLSSWALVKEAGEFYPDPLATLAYCKTLTPWVVLRHDYHPRDFTIYMYKREP